jgi:hypothetical protein
LSGISFFSMALWIRAAAPPNDNFANRIELQGSSLTFTGTLVGATREPYEVTAFWFGKSVWWSWTATESLPVTVMVDRINVSPNASAPDEEPTDHLTFWFPTNLSSFPSNACSGCLIPLPLRLADPLPNLTFIPTLGTTYQIQLNGESTNDFRIRLIATNSPIVVEQPRDLTVSPGASALLTVIAVGVRPFVYQWQFNGNDLPGETSPMLALTNVPEADAGAYSVIVSNATGIAFSEPATLAVSEEETPSRLFPVAITTNQFHLYLCAEESRYYRIESSTNLQNWQAETSFRDPRPRYSQYAVTSVVFESNACSSLVIPRASPQKYVRAVQYVPTNEICNLNLKQIRFAKELWTRDNHMWGLATARISELTPYFKNQQYPRCPTDGGYGLSYVMQFPSCTIPEHALEEPR